MKNRQLNKFARLSLLALLAATLSLTACGGGGSNNDQGISFQALGFYAQSEDGEIVPIGSSSTTISFDTTSSENTGNEATVPLDNALIGLRNNLTGQTINTQRVFLSYIIGGATIQPPSTHYPMTRVLSPSSNNDIGIGEGGESGGVSVDTTLPPAVIDTADENAGPVIYYHAVRLVPSEVSTWINLNRGSLPEPPFSMEVTVTVRGVTSAGDTLETNPATLLVVVGPDVPIPPSSSSDGTTGEETALEE